jgi:hypothetical protein
MREAESEDARPAGRKESHESELLAVNSVTEKFPERS